MDSYSPLRLVGGTPLVELARCAPRPGVRIFAKLEGQNPSGSIKDRIALAMVEDAERRGLLTPGATLFEASSGNTAIALALVARQRGYRLRVVLPEGVVPTICDVLARQQVQIDWCEPRAGMKGAIDHARSLAAELGGFALGQFTNLVNVETHYRQTGEEIVRQLERVDVFIAGIGTGGTIMGVGRRLREANPDVKLIGVEPRIGDHLQGLRCLGEAFAAPLLDLDLLDRRFIVDASAALKRADEITRREGLMVGVSSGATLHIALRVAEQLEQANIVVMFADSGWKYLPSRPWDAAEAQDEQLNELHWW